MSASGGGYFVGVDAGSSATKCVVLDAAGNLVGKGLASSGFSYDDAAATALNEAMEEAGASHDEIIYCISTGYGRESIGLAKRHLTEITCHARGAREWYPEVRNIIDIGGQDTKIIRINEHGKMADYRMNSKCAAGTGTFLESTALKLGVPLSTIDELALSCQTKTVLNSYCTVFAGTEIIERIKAGEAREDVCMGLFRSIALRVFEMLASADGPVAATGGVVAHCRAMRQALEEVLKTDVHLPPFPQYAGAFGAALLAREAFERGQATVVDHPEPKTISTEER